MVATDVLSGQDVLLSRGDAVDAIAASAAIPAVFPPVSIDGRDLIDGGVVNNTPLSHALALGADGSELGRVSGAMPRRQLDAIIDQVAPAAHA